MSGAASPLVLMTTGGTGGHVYPALAVALELRARGYRVAWIGTRRGLESRVVPAHGIDLHHLPVQGVRGKNLWQKLRAGFWLVVAMVRALWLVARLRPACVVGFGGFVSGPTGLAAWLLRRPLLIHEQNAVSGTTNRMLAPFARRIAMGFAGAFPSSAKTLHTGNPLRAEIIAAGSDAQYDFSPQRPLRLLVLGGSLGASAINDVVPGALRRFNRDGSASIQIVHQTGEAHYPEMAQRYHDLDDQLVRVAPFIDDMAQTYQWADLVLCRAGALTVSELAMMGRPSILVPLPRAIDDHQTANARMLVAAGAGVIMLQNELDASRLVNRLRALLADPQQLMNMSQAAYAVATPQATAQICDECEALIND